MDDQVFEPVPIRYTGLFADSHLVDANHFGRSVASIARIGNDIVHLLFFAEIASPKRHKINFYVRPSKENGLLQEIIAVMNNGAMPMFHPILLKLGSVLVERIFDVVIKTALGRKTDAGMAMDKLHDLATQQMEFSREVHAGQMQDKAWMQGMIERLVAENRTPLRELPAPVGHSVRQLQIGAPQVGPMVDEPAAEVLRAREPLELGDTAEHQVFVEGVFKTNGACRLKLVPDDRIVSGKITDPALAMPSNVYTTALDRNLPLKVTAKPTLKNGVIHTLYVSDAKLADIDIVAG
ncbi:hypothetical protein [Bradyrhizobium sp. Leo170]|uniref:DUF7947 five-stranded beta-barrel domain-containing protein n=1 Tax=Bradyrhizobium sp. Leo170 TaxID=1571199 RepID=UPI0013EE6550|nr:hypothetical protein [Bradyrhizobium sp. Leo170]